MNWLIDFIKMVWNAIFGGGGPSGTFFKCSMFFPADLSNPWPNNQGVDSSLDWATDEGRPWVDARRKFAYKQTRANGADTILFIAEKLYNNPALQKKLTSKDGEVAVARKAGIQRWIVDLFNDGHGIPVAKREDYIKQVCPLYSWASDKQVAFMVCLESDEKLAAAEVMQIVEWIYKYAPGKRVIIGSANPNFLKAFTGTGAELWLETACHPFKLNMQNADVYIDSVNVLKSYGPAIAGEYGRGSGDAAQYVTERAIKIGCSMVGSYVEG